MSQFGFALADGNYAGCLRAGQVGFGSDGSLWIGHDGVARFVMTPKVELHGLEKSVCCFRTQRPRFNAQGRAHLSVQLPVTVQTCEGEYRGDCIEEVSMAGEEMLALGIGLRLPGVISGMAAKEVSWEIQAPGADRVIPMTGAERFEDLGNWVILGGDQQFLGVYWGSEAPFWCDRLGGEGLWAKLGDGTRAPFYHGWETHLRQWHEPRGWHAQDSARVLLRPVQEGLRLALCWHHGSDLALDATCHFSGVVALTWANDQSVVRARLEALAAPVKPSAKGAAVVGFDYLDGTYRFRRTDKQCEVTFPPDPAGRTAVVRVDGPASAAFACMVDDRPVAPQLVSIGRTDDPYGPHDGRPDGGSRPVLAAQERPAERVEVAVQLSPQRPTRVGIAQTRGLSMSYLSQDDRQELLLFCSDDPDRPLGRLSLQDLRLRDLRPPQMVRPAVACLPLYWYLMNAPSPWHSANQLNAWEIRRNGPDVVALQLVGANPGRALLSTFDVEISLSSSGALNLDVTAQLEVKGRFPLPELQFLNLFPENTRMPEEWTHDETMLAGKEFLRAVDNRGDARTFSGVKFKPPFFLAQYSTRRYPAGTAGNLALLVTECSPADLPLSYEPCPCWLDNHLQVLFPAGEPQIGVPYTVHYRVAIWPDDGLGREGIAEMYRRSLVSGALEVGADRKG